MDLIDRMISCSDEDREKINRIVNAVENQLPGQEVHALMDLTAVHVVHGLELDDMVEYAESCDQMKVFNVMHDIIGINNCLDRTTGDLLNCFWPRFAKRTRLRA